ncbi:MAG: ATP-binding protein [Bacteroidales bacterium]|nr:ATP-binding protein [Bacteroidales bacterium]
MENRKEAHFIIENRVEELAVLFEKIEQLTEIWDFTVPLTMNINLVLEEVVSNVIFYAYNDKFKHEINIGLSLQNNLLTIVITDDGKPFDPTSNQLPDINLKAEDRPVGGLGIFLISKIMTEVYYERKENLNILTLKKTI